MEKSLRDGLPKFLTRFDEDQIQRLVPLLKSKVAINFPFFANTFPLAYHYYHLLKTQQSTTGEVLREFIVEKEWETPPLEIRDVETESPDVIVTYATDKLLNHWTTSHIREKRLIKESVTVYRHRMMFIPFTSYIGSLFDHSEISQIIEPKHGDEVTPIPITDKLFKGLQNRYSRTEIFSDIPDQAAELQKLLQESSHIKQAQVIADWMHAFDFGAENTILKIYFYGAPLTAALTRRRNLLPIAVPEQLNADKDLRRTYIVIFQMRDNHTDVEAIRKSLLDYHHELYGVAADRQQYDELLNVFWAYNRYAERHQLASAFHSVGTFASCLARHHEAE